VTAITLLALFAWAAFVVARAPWLSAPQGAVTAKVGKRELPTTDRPPGAAAFESEEQPTGPIARILVTAVGQSDPGLHRKQNEDAYVVLEPAHLYAVADGMGRHAAGEVASQLCIETLREPFVARDFPPEEPGLVKRLWWLKYAISRANSRVFEAAKRNDSYQGMGTTVVALHFSPNRSRAYLAHVGDSRCCRFRRGELAQLTRDHTLGEAGIGGKHAHFLSRAVGIEEHVEIDLTTDAPEIGDIYLLCSDGLSRMVDEATICAILSDNADLDVAAKALIERANEGGGRDNITVILVRVDPPVPLRTRSS
jgi:protein phosphatase